jgi:hypothetical protein
MGREKHPLVYTVARSRDEGGLAELSTGLADLLNIVNARQELGELGAFARDVDRVLELLSTKQPGLFSGWPLWAALAVTNIQSLLHSGGGYLRRCRFCHGWMLMYHGARTQCQQRDCWRVRNRGYQDDWRRRTF